MQWRIQGGGGGGGATPPPPPPRRLLLEQTEARRAEKVFLETGPSPFYLKIWIRHWDVTCKIIYD